MTDVSADSGPAPAPERRSQSHGSFIWYELVTPDPEGAKSFYDAVVGWNIGPDIPALGGYRMIGRSDGKAAGGVLPLTDEMREHGARPIWLGYLCVDDVDEAVVRIVSAGGRALMAAFDIPDVGRVALVSDPQGAPLYVMKPIPPTDDPSTTSDVFSLTAEQRVGWNELPTTDPVAARRFYEEEFGWVSDEFMDMGEMGEYRFLDHRGGRIGAVFQAGNGQAPHWRFYIRVPSISAAAQTVEERGGTVSMGPHQVPTGDFILIASDPQGAEFALVGAR